MAAISMNAVLPSPETVSYTHLFVGTAAKEDRSRMNICFVMAPEYKELEADFRCV